MTVLRVKSMRLSVQLLLFIVYSQNVNEIYRPEDVPRQAVSVLYNYAQFTSIVIGLP